MVSVRCHAMTDEAPLQFGSGPLALSKYKNDFGFP
jgi:hypothetical protein